jgi:hypothetical protein
MSQRQMESSPPPPETGVGVSVWRILAGGIAGDIAMAGLYVGLVRLAEKIPPSGSAGMVWLIAIPSLLLIPMAGGVVAAYIWRPLDLRVSAVVSHSLWMPLLGVLGAAVFFREGVVCLIIVFPLLWASILGGALMGRIWFKVNRTHLNLFIFPLLALLTTGELESRTYQREVVVDRLLIHAPPEKVWPHVLAFPPITEAPDYWLFRVGLPYPVATTNSGNFAGAQRRCIFSGGLVIKEMVAEYVPRERLTFDIYEQPTHPEAYGHITLHRGRFDLIDNHDGTTTLVGSSWYTLHVRPLFYFDWWVRDMTHAVHLRVMRHVRELSEYAG